MWFKVFLKQSNDSKNWTFFSENMTQRIEPFVNMTERIDFFHYDSKNGTFFFLEYDAKNWTLFSLNVTQRIEPFFWMGPKDLNLFWEKFDS